MDDPFEIPMKMEGFAYRFIRNKELNIAMQEAEGWEICEGKEAKNLGDLILAKMPQRLADKKKAWNAIKPKLADEYATSHISRVIAEHPDLEKVKATKFVANE